MFNITNSPLTGKLSKAYRYVIFSAFAYLVTTGLKTGLIHNSISFDLGPVWWASIVCLAFSIGWLAQLKLTNTLALIRRDVKYDIPTARKRG